MIGSNAFSSPQEEAEKILSQYAKETSVQNRLQLFSQKFLGLPYGINGPLGEGALGKYDEDPLYRFDTFDCTTYVETVIALALSHNVDEFEYDLNHIRYENGEVDYLKRNHFTDLQWIPFNVENGMLSEINLDIAPAAAIKMATALIDFPNWLRSMKLNAIIIPDATEAEKEVRLEELHAEASHFSAQQAQVSYIEIDWILQHPEVLNRIPSGALVNFVRPNWDLTELIGTHMNISHQGFLFWRGQTLFLRHASTSGLVEDRPFLEYLSQIQGHATHKGINLMKVNASRLN
jgi:hypothetical protein